ncbi:MAG: hypothetical protein ACREBV_08200 [Candidatus Zixiibacteriota bacterium]
MKAIVVSANRTADVFESCAAAKELLNRNVEYNVQDSTDLDLWAYGNMDNGPVEEKTFSGNSRIFFHPSLDVEKNGKFL